MLHRKYYVINMCLPLIIGAFFYLLFRPDILLSRTIYAIFNIRPFSLLYDRIIENAIGRLLVNYLCDFFVGVFIGVVFTVSKEHIWLFDEKNDMLLYCH